MAENTQVDVKKLSFERAMEELETIVTRLEGGKVKELLDQVQAELRAAE